MAELVVYCGVVCCPWCRRWFKNTAMILFLNKKDLFENKIRKVDIRNDGSDGSAPRFLDYTAGIVTGPEGSEEATRVQDAAKTYILNLFKTKYTETEKKVWCALKWATCGLGMD